jgi:hypothetical protein
MDQVHYARFFRENLTPGGISGRGAARGDIAKLPELKASNR